MFMPLLAAIRQTRRAVPVLFAALSTTLCAALCAIWFTPALAQQPAPAAFSVGVLPNISARLILGQYQPLSEFFARQLGRKVEIVTAANFKAFAEATRNREYQLIVTAPNLGRLAQKDSQWEPLASYEPLIPALLVGSAANAESSVQAAVQQLRGKSLALANPQSLVALVGLKWLADQGLRQDQDFKVVQVANDDSLGTLLLNGEAPLAMMSMGEFRAKPEAMRKSLRVVTEMARLPGFLVMANPQMPAADKERLKALVLAFPGSEEGQRFFALTGLTGIKPAEEKDLKFLDAFNDVTRRSLGLGG